MQITILLFCLLGMFNTGDKEQKNAKETFEIAVKKLVLKDVRATITLETFDGNGNDKSRTLNVSFAKFDETKKVMIEITAPEDLLGTRILMTDYSDKEGIIEVFLPATGKIRKFRANNRRLKMVDSEIPMNHFSSSAFANYQLLESKQVTINGVDYKKIKLHLPDKSEYLIAYVDVSRELLSRIESYDSGAKLTDITEFTDYRHINSTGNELIFPHKVNVSNPSSGKASVLTINDLKTLKQIQKSDFDLVTKSKSEE
ncbi:outer membrane lipoprotein-sorting protein [Marinilabilia sp.]|uniref:outer membrane lipoprotein-sorting protein n=1 Tax=Marinilabilia sp. TaxID=2021252 RepID=UPI0025C4A191|nr:outer membrane lipoprotein-sorting protein [Marinilabilia sp.]